MVYDNTNKQTFKNNEEEQNKLFLNSTIQQENAALCETDNMQQIGGWTAEKPKKKQKRTRKTYRHILIPERKREA